MHQKVRFWLAPLLAAFAGHPGQAQDALHTHSPAAQLQALIQETWEFQMREYPLWATACGDHRYNDRLSSVTVTDYERRLATYQLFRQRLAAIPREPLSEAQQMNYDIFEHLLRIEAESYRCKSYLLPITNRTGFHISFPELYHRVPLNTIQDYENYIARLRGFKAFAGQHIELMRVGLKEGYTLPKVVFAGFEEILLPHMVQDPTQSLLYTPCKAFPPTIAQAERQRLDDACREAITQSVVPGYQAFLSFMQREYVPAGREEIGICALPNGRAYYEHCVRYFTTLEIAPEEIHQIGLSEVKRIRVEMEAVIKKVGFQGNFADFLTFLRTDPRFYVTTPEQLMKEVAYVLKRMDGELPRFFRTLPRISYGIRPVPDYIAPKTTTAYYSHPAGDGTQGGIYYVNTCNLKSRPLYEIEALSFHEAVPGHHLQIALQQELEGLPPFRRFYAFTAFIEGWALYAERLALEMGFYQDPYSDFGRLSYEMWRALRLVVDTGIHYLGWSRQQAIDFMAANSALTLHNITSEVDRYIAWPGQSLAYKMGELKIRQLRARAEEALGEKFQLRQFHDVVLLHGAVPLNILEANVEKYLAAQKQEAEK